MTASSNASNGDETTAHEAAQPKHGLSVLRNAEAKALIHLACDAVSEAMWVTSQMHGAIYGYEQEVKLDQEDLGHLRDEALTCLSTSEHYLLMLSTVLEDQASGGDLSADRAPYPLYVTSPEATDGS